MQTLTPKKTFSKLYFWGIILPLLLMTEASAQVNCPSFNINLDQYDYLICDEEDIDGKELSGIAYNPTTDLYYSVGDEGTLVEFGEDGVARTILIPKNEFGNNPCPYEDEVFNDTEGITHISGDQFAIIEEREGRVAFVTIDSTTTSISFPNEFIQLQIEDELPPCINDVGLEAIAYNFQNTEMYTVRQSSPPLVYKFPIPPGNAGEVNLTEIANLEDIITGITIKSVHGIHYNSAYGHLIAVATIEDGDPDTDGDNKRILIELTSCGDYVSHLDLEAQNYFAEDDPNNVEGITMKNGNIVLIGEGLNNGSSSKRFCLSKYPPPCPIVVTEPIYDNVYCPGDTTVIAWDANNLDGNVKIELFMLGQNSPFGTIHNSPNDGTQSYVFPTSLEEGQYFFQVSSITTPSCYNQSGYFNIAIPLIGDQLAIWSATDLTCPQSGCTIAASTEYTLTPSTLTLVGTDVDVNGSNDGIAYKDVEHVVHPSTGSYNFDDIKGSPATRIDMAVDTRGFKDIKLRFDYNSEESKTLDVRYSTNGGYTFTHLANDFSIAYGDFTPFYELVFDFSDIPAVNQNEYVVFRIDGLNDNNKDNKNDNDDFKIVNMEVFGSIDDNDQDGIPYVYGEPSISDPDDNNPCVPDSYNSACNACNVLWFSDFESGLQGWEDGGAWCLRQSIPQRSSSGNYSVRLRGHGASSNLSILFSMGNYQDADISFSFYAHGMELGDDLLFQVASNSSDNYETVQRFVSGIDFQNNAFNEKTVHLNGPFPNFPSFRFQLDGNQVNDFIYLDDIEIRGCLIESGPTCYDGIQNGTEEFIDCGGFGCDPCPCNMETPEASCYNTIDPVCGCDNVTYTNSCKAEQDGEVTEYTAGPCSTCNDGHMNGQETSIDCGGPDCAPCEDVCSNPNVYSFEYGLSGWIDGGSDCALVYKNGFGSDYSIRLRDNSASSTITSPSFTFNGDVVHVSFTFITESMESNEDFFFESSSDGGTTWDVIKNYKKVVNFLNNYRRFETLSLDLSGDIKFRFRCDASANNDFVYIDNFSIQECNLNTIAPDDDEQAMEEKNMELNSLSRSSQENLDDIHVYPNPVSSEHALHILLPKVSDQHQIQVFDMEGKVVFQSIYREELDQLKLPLTGIQNGTYILKVINSKKSYIKKFIILK